MRFACDTGGTFTDLVVDTGDGALRMYKASTTPDDPIKGVLDSLQAAADDFGMPLADLLARGETFTHGTTHAINAIITGRTAKTAFLTTKGHPDILVLREGGRIEPFNGTVPFPDPLVPRALTFEVPERIEASGAVSTPLDEDAVREVLEKLRELNVEAIGVCLLWSIVNPVHEARVGELIQEILPDTPYTLSHRINPALREYRRASSACMDASLKPLMQKYLGTLVERLGAAGFGGRVLVLTSLGGMMDAAELAGKPIHAINSGPSMAPIAGRHFANLDGAPENIIVADTGGTTYDVSLVRRNRIPLTRETWIGQPFRGHMTGFPSVDVKSVGAGGGSIARVDSGGVLHVGPESAGAVPGPACYGLGGTQPTLTDACIVLGYLDPAYFLGGSKPLDGDAAAAALRAHVAGALGLSIAEAAAAVLDVATENMVQAITDITVNQGIDPESAVLVGGGGAAGLNAVFIARRLGCRSVVIPEVGAALSAAGALLSDLTSQVRATAFTTSSDFDRETVNRILDNLEGQCREFIDGPGRGTKSHSIEFSVEARYNHQVWEIEVPLNAGRFENDGDVERFVADFHAAHEEIFAFRDPSSIVEMVGWSATARCSLQAPGLARLKPVKSAADRRSRPAFFSGSGSIDTAVHDIASMTAGQELQGPAIIESPFTTVVVDPGSSARLTENGNLMISL